MAPWDLLFFVIIAVPLLFPRCKGKRSAWYVVFLVELGVELVVIVIDVFHLILVLFLHIHFCVNPVA